VCISARIAAAQQASVMVRVNVDMLVLSQELGNAEPRVRSVTSGAS